MDLETQAKFDAFEKRLDAVEAKMLVVTADHQKFFDGLKDAAKELLTNKMIAAVLPKDMREKLQRYVELPMQAATTTAAGASANGTA